MRKLKKKDSFQGLKQPESDPNNQPPYGTGENFQFSTSRPQKRMF